MKLSDRDILERLIHIVRTIRSEDRITEEELNEILSLGLYNNKYHHHEWYDEFMELHEDDCQE